MDTGSTKPIQQRRRTISILAGAATLLLCATASHARICNHSGPPICDQPYDAVAYATTHNAFAAAEISWPFPNQQYWLTRQLNDGVRALMLDVYLYENALTGVDLDVYLCHGDCQLGVRRLTSGLQDIKDFLDANPDEVITIIFESYVNIDDVKARFDTVGLGPYLHEQTIGQPWPTLNEMIDAGHRLVVFSDRVDTPRPGYHYVWDFALETHFSAETPSDFSCARNRGSQSNPLFILNHFLTMLSGSRMLAEQVNHNPYFATRAVQCWNERAHLPNFVTVDFYDIGDVFAVVDELNTDRLLSATPPPTHTTTPTVTPTATPTPFACAAAPNPSCATPDRASMHIGRAAGGTRLNLHWKGRIAAADLGTPEGVTDYALCLYADGQSAAQLDIPAGGSWRRYERGGVLKRYAYRKTGGAPSGVDKATVRVGEPTNGKLSIHAAGALQLPASITAATSSTALVAQLIVQDNAACWSAPFSGDVVRLP